MGIVYAQFQRYSQAETAFKKVISIDPEFTGARINLGNLQFLKENYREAVKSYAAILEILEAKGRGESSTALKVLINLARSKYVIERAEEKEGPYTILTVTANPYYSDMNLSKDARYYYRIYPVELLNQSDAIISSAGYGVSGYFPAAPSLTGTINTTGLACEVSISGDYAFIADSSSGLQIIDLWTGN
ncbi:MAG: hypothetical protein PF693_20220 [Spirochaetia bacterium]|nr:hypothetical protein [Spirochaetia bacterium]